MKKLLLFGAMCTFLCAHVFSQSDILIIDYNNAFSSDRSMNNSRVYNHLSATQGTVTRIGAIPASISAATYDQVWIYGNMGAATPARLNPIINYINSGGSVYVQSEVSCCNSQAAYAQAVMRAVVSGGAGIVHNPTLGSYYRYESGPSFGCPTVSHYGAAVRPYTGMALTNALWRGATGCGSTVNTNTICAVLFKSCDMSSGQGSFASAGDFNMFIQSSSCGGVGIIGTPNRTALIDLIHDRLLEGKNCSPCGVIILPVKLSNFSAEKDDAVVRLNWTTTEERSHDFFTVERSKDEVNYEEVTQVRGALNSNHEINYIATDHSPYGGYSYYRLKSTDTNGEASYSDVRMVSFAGSAGLDVYHVTASDHLVIDNLQEVRLQVEILSVTGQQVALVNAAANSQTKYATTQLTPGVYFARAKSAEGGVVSRKFVVRR